MPGEPSGDLEIKSEIPPNKPKDYLSILGTVKLPESPEGMPQEVIIPKKALGDFFQAVLDTSSDNKERNQLISVNRKGGFEKGRLFVGLMHQISEAGALTNLAHAYFLNKALLDFHTHPFQGNNLGVGDITSIIYENKLANIYLLGSSAGGEALLQTAKSAKFPFSSILNAKRFDRRRMDLAMQFQDEVNKLTAAHRGEHRDTVLGLVEKLKRESFDPRAAELVEDYGFAYYRWTPINGTLKPQDIENGLKLTRILSPRTTEPTTSTNVSRGYPI